ncbi:unnamed protein product [Penicillium bialowiezense]
MARKKNDADEDDASMVRNYLPQAAKVLRGLHEKKKIEGRVSGKQTVYHALQDPSDSITPSAAAALKLEIDNLESQLPTLKAEEKRARAALASLKATPRISELRHDISRLEEEESAIRTRLARHHGEDPIALSPAEREKLESEWKQWQRHASVRRRICRELWGQCSEVLPEGMTAAELWFPTFTSFDVWRRPETGDRTVSEHYLIPAPMAT